MKYITRTISKTVAIKDLFDNLKIENKEHSNKIPNFSLRVKTPYGYNEIVNLFRTELQETTMLYFSNNKTLKTSKKHRLVKNGDWEFVENIHVGDFVETDVGITKVKKKIVKNKKEILYDISVKDVNCYYSNKILSHNSWSLVTVGAHAMKRGLNVVHYTMELNENYVGKRYDAHLSGISGQNLKYHKEDIVKAIDNVSGNLIVKYYPPKGATVNTIRAHFDKCIMTGFKPNLVIVDYADLLRSVTAMKEVRHTIENIYEDLRAFAGECAIPVWTATQSNRSSMEQDIISADNVAEAFSKIMVADFIMSLSRKITDKVAGTGRWHIVKNRFGPDGMTFPSKINTSMGSIQIFEESTSSGKDTKQQMDKGNLYVRKLLKKKYDELNNGNNELQLGERVKVGPVDKFSGFEE
jgi:hypothetical protein